MLNVYADAYRQRKEADGKEELYKTYLLSRWVWQEKIDIEKILNWDKKKESMTDEQMLRQVKALNKMFGGEVKINGTEE